MSLDNIRTCFLALSATIKNQRKWNVDAVYSDLAVLGLLIVTELGKNNVMVTGTVADETQTATTMELQQRLHFLVLLALSLSAVFYFAYLVLLLTREQRSNLALLYPVAFVVAVSCGVCTVNSLGARGRWQGEGWTPAGKGVREKDCVVFVYCVA
ncbi:uncharacterized protein LOC119583077 [Penaeus monodon]|uniref:uncharacterized protein LOC119583077 n=1 Tax=Penaeus monodon TaxID=6687 RepID=UPI0018A7A564|nr:uncharacterized protein LOC119583077 [Penaeus monodon]